MSERLTQQEMFDRAWRGLKSQSWEKATTDRGYGGPSCAYLTEDGRRCAWGWIDPEATGALRGDDLTLPLAHLRSQGIGLAASLSDEDFTFASELQNAHDDLRARGDLKTRLKAFATEHWLTIPED